MLWWVQRLQYNASLRVNSALSVGCPSPLSSVVIKIYSPFVSGSLRCLHVGISEVRFVERLSSLSSVFLMSFSYSRRRSFVVRSRPLVLSLDKAGQWYTKAFLYFFSFFVAFLCELSDQRKIPTLPAVWGVGTQRYMCALNFLHKCWFAPCEPEIWE